MIIKGKLAVITGSGQGLGKVFATRLLQEGAKVCISDVNEEVGRSTLTELAATYGDNNVHFIKCDVLVESEMEALFEGAQEAFKDKVSIFCNNAGINHLPGWRLCMEIDIMSVMFGSSMAMSKMDKREGGSGGLIVNTASLAGIVTGFSADSVSYFVAKHGVVALTRTLGCNYTLKRTGVKVQCICPSFADTQIVSTLPGGARDKIESKFGLMTPEFVGDAFVKLIKSGENGAALGVLKDTPPFFIPDYSVGMVKCLAVTALIANKLFGCELLTTRHQLIIISALFILFNLFLYLLLL